MKTYLKKQKKFFLAAGAFGITAGFLCAVYACFGLFPFGGKTLAWGDMKQQVIPLMLEFKDVLAGKSGFLLNLQNAGGMSFWGVFFFFLSSPFTFLVIFLEKADIYFLVNVLVLVKLALSAATASLFFYEEQPKLDGRFHLFLCISYALCGYGLLYYQNIVWLDALCLFPLLALGFRRAVFDRKVILFTAVLTAMLVINYYLSYMVLLALILMAALFVKNCVPAERRGETAGKIGFSAILSLLLSAIVWLPSLLQCLRSARTGRGLVETIQSGGLFTELTTALPVLLCSAAVTAFPVLAARFSKSPKRKTLSQLFVLTSVPVALEPINKLWHTGSYQAFPVRYGYIPVFLALWYLADLLTPEQQRESLGAAAKRRGRTLLFLAIGSLSITGILILLLKFDTVTSYTRSLWFDDVSFLFLLLFALLAAGLMWLTVSLWSRGKISRHMMGWTLLAVCLLQGGYHASVLIGSAANLPERGKAVLQTEGKIRDDGLYRVKQEFKFCDVNLLGAAGFLTLNHYTSLTDEKYLHALKKLGYSSYWMETSACCGTKLSDSLLSNKYSLSGNLEFRETGSGNLGYVLPSGILPEALPDGDRFAVQDLLFQQVTGRGDAAFARYEPTEQIGVQIEHTDLTTNLRKTGKTASMQYRLSIGSRETLYFDAFGENTNRLREKINGAFQVSVNGDILTKEYPSQRSNGILELGSFENETVLIEIQVRRDVESLRSFGVYGLKSDKAIAFTAALKNAELQWKKGRLFGSASAQGGESLFLSVPYAPGMEATVNGQAADMKIVLDCFLEIPLEQGENRIEFSYLPQGVKLGAALSVFGGLLILLSLIFKTSRPVAWAVRQWHKIAGALLSAAFFVVLAIIYAAPLAVWLGKFL